MTWVTRTWELPKFGSKVGWLSVKRETVHLKEVKFGGQVYRIRTHKKSSEAMSEKPQEVRPFSLKWPSWHVQEFSAQSRYSLGKQHLQDISYHEETHKKASRSHAHRDIRNLPLWIAAAIWVFTTPKKT